MSIKSPRFRGDDIEAEITKGLKKIERARADLIKNVETATKDTNTQKYAGTAEFADAVIKEL